MDKAAINSVEEDDASVHSCGRKARFDLTRFATRDGGIRRCCRCHMVPRTEDALYSGICWFSIDAIESSTSEP